ncbi:leukocyte receptor cluster member 9-like [Coturnix japonica]|uniref:leukocyte receptor cluster member 9-like n=1 Tax=Coturnix japonica TaxID=93934 RepID=UPI0013A5EE95|nr:leukocyte receptor cluster member 9-like [Coturnix japonica]
MGINRDQWVSMGPSGHAPLSPAPFWPRPFSRPRTFGHAPFCSAPFLAPPLFGPAPFWLRPFLAPPPFWPRPLRPLPGSDPEPTAQNDQNHGPGPGSEPMDPEPEPEPTPGPEPGPAGSTRGPEEPVPEVRFGAAVPVPVPVSCCRWFLEGRCRFGSRCRNLHPGSAQPEPEPNRDEPETNPEPETNRDEPEPEGKKPPLRRAADVLNRIRWDPALEPGFGSVQYRDRFRGLVERPMSDLYHGPLCDAGPDELPVPEHRIQRIRYRGNVVWDRKNRIDHVFGTGSGGEKRDLAGNGERGDEY